ncbi:hypothetical protein [Eoetvoesiella caeni]|uniref:Transposase n=1 Tax=Eoetvoesiella caeni TaxID=645616 RepID=A0A366H0U0_9BURK|nr:hypothetical protein [Eoetvoesiella caeni]MCI2811001.1 hypothetical protein [Eoetvoesiella caeni]NYT56900.1 hypothetical protein [Eoetvoesiella caeni]RBP35469.1 hypothetical protein DFR37_11773 [Eoetvoesiella caeni]
MQVGTALEAPEGYVALEPGLTYYFLRSNRVTGLAQIVLFTFCGRWLAHLRSMPRAEFEEALINGLIVAVASPQGPPPFLAGAKGRNLRSHDLQRVNAKKLHVERKEERILKIAPLIKDIDSILSAANPEKELNRYAHTRGFNAQRMRFWFFSYACFGADSDVLFPHYFNCGRWNRLDRTAGVKWGRKSKSRGTLSGSRLSHEDIAKIVSSYLRHRAPGRPLTVIYALAMHKDFNAAVHIDEQIGQKRLVSTDGKPLPTYDQYRYQLRKALGVEAIQTARWGATRYRRTKAAHQGTFTESVSNLLERVEADAYYCEDRPLSYQGNGSLRPLVVTRLTDSTSGMRLGIGFAFGKEDSQSYHSALFCAAIPKKKFCQLFDIVISEADWPSQGLPLHYITDRGPGVKRERNHDARDGEGLIIRELTPSGQGQSKALVESAQRRTTKLEGPTRAPQSTLTVIEMVVREIHRLLAENQTSDVSSRLTPEMIQHDTFPSPNGVWNFLDSRARNDSHHVSFDDAVRRFLVDTEVSINRSGVWLKGQRYDSSALRQNGILDRASSVGAQRLRAYVFPFSVRYIWVEVAHEIIEVEAELGLNDDKAQLVRTAETLTEEYEKRKQLGRERKQDKHATTVEHLGRFGARTGKDWHPKPSARPVPRTSPAAIREEEKEIERLLKGKEG